MYIDFFIKYYTDSEFKEFIDSILNPNSDLMIEYRMNKIYEILLQHENYHIDDLNFLKSMEKNIDEAINFFTKKEEYEKCNNLIKIKKKLFNNDNY